MPYTVKFHCNISFFLVGSYDKSYVDRKINVGSESRCVHLIRTISKHFAKTDLCVCVCFHKINGEVVQFAFVNWSVICLNLFRKDLKPENPLPPSW